MCKCPGVHQDFCKQNNTHQQTHICIKQDLVCIVVCLHSWEKALFSSPYQIFFCRPDSSDCNCMLHLFHHVSISFYPSMLSLLFLLVLPLPLTFVPRVTASEGICVNAQQAKMIVSLCMFYSCKKHFSK